MLEYVFEMEHLRNRVNDAIKALDQHLTIISGPPDAHPSYYTICLVKEHLSALAVELNDTYVRERIGFVGMFFMRRKVNKALRAAYSFINEGLSFEQMMKALRNGLTPAEAKHLMENVQ